MSYARCMVCRAGGERGFTSNAHKRLRFLSSPFAEGTLIDGRATVLVAGRLSYDKAER
jgi:hypothetical protein